MTARAAEPELLLERQGELESAHQTLAEVVGGEGRILLVEGPPGIGKTRLVEAIVGSAVDAGFEVHRARGDDLEAGFAYGVLRQLTTPVLARLDPSERATLLEGPAAFLASLVEGVGHPATNGPGSEGLGAAYGVYQLIQDLAERRPQLLMVDDLHWADLPSVHALVFLARRLADLPVLLLFAFRPSEDGSAKELSTRLDAAMGSRKFVLSPLGEESVSLLARAMLDSSLDGSVGRRVWEVTGGNPFLVRELLKAVREGDPEWGDLGLAYVEQLVPERVGHTVLRRLADAGDAATRLARAVAVLGEAALRDAAQLAELSDTQAVTAADRLVAADILVPGTYLRFTHRIVREAVRSGIFPAVRSLAHAQAARLLADRGAPPERVTVHLLEALPRADPWVVDTLMSVAATEQQRGSPETAVSLLTRALAEPPPPEQLSRVTLALAQAQAASGDPDALATAREALGRASDPTEKAEATLQLARTLAMAGDFWSAVDLLDDKESVETGLDPELALQLESELLGNARLHLRTRREALARLERLAPLALPPRPASVVLLANLALTAQENGEPPEEIARLAELALREDWLIESGSFQIAYAAEALAFIDRLEEAKRACDTAADFARRRGWVMLSAVIHGLRSAINMRRGAVADAEADARIGDRLTADLVDRGLPASGRPYQRGHLADALMARGEWDEAARVLNEAGPEERPEDNPLYLETRGRLRLAQSDAASALEDFRACGALLAGRGGADTPSVSPWRSEAALALLQLGRQREAQELGMQELELAAKQQVASAIGEALVAIGLIEGDQDGIGRLQAAVEILQESPRVLTRVRALIELGSMLRRSRQREAARGFLVDALDLAHRHGAIALAERAREELVVAGGRPRRLATTGVGALTPSERRVAQLVAQGLTNRQIAGRLFISTRTVTTHLTHVYQKLGKHSRSELSALLEDGI